MGNNVLLKTIIQDWRVGEGVAEDAENKEDLKPYDLTLEFNDKTGQLVVIIDGRKDDRGLNLFIEINEGKPCVHIGTEMCGDNLIHLFATDEGLVITPERDTRPEQAEKSRYTYNTSQGLLYRNF